MTSGGRIPGDELVQPVAPLVELIGKSEHERNLRELRRLERELPEPNPPVRVFERRRREQDTDEERDRHAQKPVDDHRDASAFGSRSA